MRICENELRKQRAWMLITALAVACGGGGSVDNTDARGGIHADARADAAGARADGGANAPIDPAGAEAGADAAAPIDVAAGADTAVGSRVDAAADARTSGAVDTPADAAADARASGAVDTPADAPADARADASADTSTVLDQRKGDTGLDANTQLDAGTVADTEPFVLESYQQCGKDGHVHWFDSRGAMGQRVATCDECGHCRNSSATEAACDVVEKDFTPCRLVTDPDRSYDICIRGVCRSPGCGTSDCNVPSPHFPLADTNQRMCFDDKVEIDCPSEGEPFFGQDAQCGWDSINQSTARFTIDNTGTMAHPMVIDNVTGLVWQGCAAGFAGLDCEVDEGPYPELNFRQALAYCEDLEWRGHTDWRLPDPYELYSIVDISRRSPSIDTGAFPNTPQTSFWSSSSREGNPSQSWRVSFNNSQLSLSYTDQEHRVRCVRGGAFVPRSFQVSVLSSHRVVSDNVTELMWQGCPAGLTGDDCSGGSVVKYTWQDALAYCEGLVWGGHEDWRLPNAKELQGIQDLNRDPAIDLAAFPRTSDSFWSSSTDIPDTAAAMQVSFEQGNINEAGKDLLRIVRCVR